MAACNQTVRDQHAEKRVVKEEGDGGLSRRLQRIAISELLSANSEVVRF